MTEYLTTPGWLHVVALTITAGLILWPLARKPKREGTMKTEMKAGDIK